MTKTKRHTDAEIGAKLREAATLSAEGRTQSEIAKTLGVSVMTFHRWRKAKLRTPFSIASIAAPPPGNGSPLHVTESSRLSRIAELQLENTRLRKLVTDLLLERMSRGDEQQQFYRELSAKKA